jgi:hypothetical protein
MSFVAALSNSFINSSCRPYLLEPVNATMRACGRKEGQGLRNDRVLIDNTQSDLCDVCGCCCDEIDCRPVRRHIAINVCRVTVESHALSLI